LDGNPFQKGYTTVDSSYPLRNVYYTDVPKDKRKELAFRGYLKDISVDHYTRGGLLTSFNPKFVEGIKKMRTDGYKIREPSERISATMAFKIFRIIIHRLSHTESFSNHF
jgi:hypothetical protein